MITGMLSTKAHRTLDRCAFANGVLFEWGEWGCLWGCALRPVCLATGVPLESLLAHGDTWSGLTDDRVVVVAKTGDPKKWRDKTLIIW